MHEIGPFRQTDLVCIDALYKGMKYPPLAVLRPLGSQYLVWCQIFDSLCSKDSVCWFIIWFFQDLKEASESMTWFDLLLDYPHLFTFGILSFNGWIPLVSLNISTSICRLEVEMSSDNPLLPVLFIWVSNGLETFTCNPWFNEGT